MDRESRLGCEFWVWKCVSQHFRNVPVPSPPGCVSSERCESQGAAPARNANSGELSSVLWWLVRLTEHFAVVLSVSE